MSLDLHYLFSICHQLALFVVVALNLLWVLWESILLNFGKKMNMLFNSPGRSVRNGKNCAPVLSAAGSLWPRAVFKTPGRVFPIQITPLVNNIYICITYFVVGFDTKRNSTFSNSLKALYRKPSPNIKLKSLPGEQNLAIESKITFNISCCDCSNVRFAFQQGVFRAMWSLAVCVYSD